MTDIQNFSNNLQVPSVCPISLGFVHFWPDCQSCTGAIARRSAPDPAVPTHIQPIPVHFCCPSSLQKCKSLHCPLPVELGGSSDLLIADSDHHVKCLARGPRFEYGEIVSGIREGEVSDERGLRLQLVININTWH